MALQPLAPEKLYNSCDLGPLTFETTAELKPLPTVLGQARALDAVQFGVGMAHKGYNIFVLGTHNSGRKTMLRRFFQEYAPQRPTPPDWCYVNNFEIHHKPISLEFPTGTASGFARDMQLFIDDLKTTLPSVFESDDYRQRRQSQEEAFQLRQEEAFEELQKKAEEQDLTIIRTPTGMAVAPTKDGNVIRAEVFNKLSEEERSNIEAKIETMQKALQETFRKIPEWHKEQREKIKKLNSEVVNYAVGHLMDELQTKYRHLPNVCTYLYSVEHDIVENFGLFLEQAGEKQEPSASSSDSASPQDPFWKYKVNVIVDNSQTQGAPADFETHPTHMNLIGRSEHVSQFGALFTNFTLIKPGALHRANGGYLVIDALKLLLQPFSWDALKRALQGREIRIESPGQTLSLISTVSLEPEPIPLNVKVVLTGDRFLYYLLCQADPEFSELFKVMADFEDEVKRDDPTVKEYARLFGTIATEEDLLPLTRDAVARVIERCARMAEHGEKLTTRIGDIADLVRESDHFAREAGKTQIDSPHVDKAVESQINRASRLRERSLDMITEGTVLIDTEGEKTGQINGLSVLMLGNHSFGRPSRITARIGMGKGNVIDIEREVKLGGPLHSKGVMILSSFLAGRFGREMPLPLSASLVFEQSYGGVEGDSASSAELYALLSALADCPIKQSLAVTGSVNQFGQVQAIGGVNEKIEGFFDVCRERELTGDQGVLIPASNVRHLMLREDVVDACREGRFHIYPVTSIDEGVELLCSVPAGVPDGEGVYPEGSIYRRISDRIADMVEKRRKLMAPEKGEADNNQEP